VDREEVLTDGEHLLVADEVSQRAVVEAAETPDLLT